jgi:hypothetical protein
MVERRKQIHEKIGGTNFARPPASRGCSRSKAIATRRAMLADIYHWFTEGFDTRDLIEAKALLEELS